MLADLIRASEITGHIDETLVRAADHFDRELQTRTRIRGALMYPAIVFCMALAVATGLVVFVLPQFRVLFEQYGAKLPPIASALLELLGLCPGQRHLDPGRDPGRHPRDRLVRAHGGREGSGPISSCSDCRRSAR